MSHSPHTKPGMETWPGNGIEGDYGQEKFELLLSTKLKRNFIKKYAAVGVVSKLLCMGFTNCSTLGLLLFVCW